MDPITSLRSVENDMYITMILYMCLFIFNLCNQLKALQTIIITNCVNVIVWLIGVEMWRKRRRKIDGKR